MDNATKTLGTADFDRVIGNRWRCTIRARRNGYEFPCIGISADKAEAQRIAEEKARSSGEVH